MVFVETTIFSKLLPGYLDDDEYRGLQSHLIERPDAGAVIQRSGGSARFDGLLVAKANRAACELSTTG
jgi:hypothetical protein